MAGAIREVLQRAPKHLGTLAWLTCLLHNQGLHAEADEYQERKLQTVAEAAPAGSPYGFAQDRLATCPTGKGDVKPCPSLLF
jgi:hypothetical protein